MLGVRDGVANDILQEDLEDTAGLLVDEAGDTLHTATTSETTDSLVQRGAEEDITLRCEGGCHAQSDNVPAW